MPWPEFRRAVFAVALMIAAIAVIAGITLWTGLLSFPVPSGPQRLIVRNRTSQEIRNVELTFTPLGKQASRAVFGTMGPGDERVVTLDNLDVSVELRFQFEGSEQVVYREDYVDLWSGESYAFEIGASGEVASGYDYGQGIID